jgi:DNA invertase Pin-like site-specific DNA recombinase
LLEDGYSIRAADIPGADDLIMRVYAAMAQKERELISERTRAALGAAKARGTRLGGDRGKTCRSLHCDRSATSDRGQSRAELGASFQEPEMTSRSLTLVALEFILDNRYLRD